MSGNLYQPYSNTKLPNGTQVMLNAPYDKWGVVLKYEGYRDGVGYHVHLVRGKGNADTPSGAFAKAIWTQ